MDNITALRCDLEYSISADTHFCFNLQAVRGYGQQVLQESLQLTPEVPLQSFEDARSGNRFFRCDALPGRLRVRYDARVALLREAPDTSLPECPVKALPHEVLHYLMPSRYCQSDVMARAAQHLFGQVAPGYQRVAHICEWIRQNTAYQIGVSTPLTTAQEVYLQRAGVCRDFAHLGITFCRALNIPARLVVGYVHFDEPPQDFHAIFEAWLGDRWVMFDPTGLVQAHRIVRVSTGRDAKDTAFATLFGAVVMTRMELQVNEDDSPPVDVPDPVQATVLLAA
ncbi:transglutaminase family protein [Xylophilus sp. GW821-FHT01B05]